MPNPHPIGGSRIFIGQHRCHHRFFGYTPNEGQVIPAVVTYFGGIILGASFMVQAYIHSTTVRYMQFVKGSFKYDGLPQPQRLYQGNLDVTTFKEDGNENGVYGVLGHNIRGLSIYSTGNDNGVNCLEFKGYDTPSDSMQCDVGVLVEIDLTFLGVLCEAGDTSQIYAARQWHVRGSHTKE